jgi:hypothetical protein
MRWAEVRRRRFRGGGREWCGFGKGGFSAHLDLLVNCRADGFQSADEYF